MRVVNYGGGVNSTSLLVEAVKREIPVDLIVFADTGSERPETYDYLGVFSAWLRKQGYPEVTTTRWIRKRAPHTGKFIPLHIWCETEKTVPSRAYGFSGCTVKWKQQPADSCILAHPDVVALHAEGKQVERWIGYDAGEPQRAVRMLEKSPNPELWIWKAPLLDWDMGREECLASIASVGLSSPGKSACWMCPSTRKPEIDQLALEHPELLKRSLDMESAAIEAGNLGVNKRKGLGGRLNWRQYVETGLGINPEDLPCGCYDGSDD